MKIGFDAKRAFYNHSGLGNYSRHTISLLSEFAPQNKYYLFTHSTKNAIRVKSAPNVFVKKATGFNKIFYRSWRTYRIVEDLNKHEIDLYHGLSNELPITIQKSSIPGIVTIHDLIFMRYPEFYYNHDREIYKSKFLKSCINADKIIAISEQTKLDIINFFNIEQSKISVVYQGCDPLFRKVFHDNELQKVKEKYALPKDFILNVGTIEKRKNILSVIQSMHENKIDIPLVVIGRKTAYYNKVESYIRQHKLQNKILFFHNIQFEELPVFYKLAKIFIFPSLFEGFGIPILEAINSGTPVITNKNGCFKEAAGSNSLLINPTEIDEISMAINNLLSDSALRNNVIKEGLKYAEKFTEDKIANNLINIYKSVV